MDAKLLFSLTTITFIYIGQVTCFTSSHRSSPTADYWWLYSGTSPVPSYCQNLALPDYQTTEASLSVNTPVRLNGGRDYSYGTVEIYHRGEWGTVCDDNFDVSDARVICRMLGFSSGYAYSNAYFGQGSGCIILSSLGCNGWENDIALCKSSGWFRHGCGHHEDAGVSCYGSTTDDLVSTGSTTDSSTTTTMSQPYQTTDAIHCEHLRANWSATYTTRAYTPIRLVGGDGYSYGRVEIYHEGVWGTVCDDSFDNMEAVVICQMRGFYDGIAYTNAQYGRGTGCILLDDLQCRGYESDIASCVSNGWFNHNCGHDEDAGVRCYSHKTTRTLSTTTPTTTPTPSTLKTIPTTTYKTTSTTTSTNTYCSISSWFLTTATYTSVRLAGGNGYSYGRVEVYHAGIWGTVCDDSFDGNEAIVICRMLGYSSGTAYGNAYYGQGSGCISLDELRCNGYESNIAACSSNGWFNNDCGHNEDASVYCYSTTTTDYAVTTEVNTPIRLVNGPTMYSGRVEVFHNGQWGTICDRSFDDVDARVICRMLGFYRGNSYSKAYGGAHFGQGGGPIWLGYLTCYGYEYDVQNCGHNGWNVGYTCGHYEDVGVDCNSYSSYTLPWWFDMTTENERPTTSSGPRLTDTINVNCNEYGWNIRIDMNLLRHIYPGSKASDIYLGENTCNGVESWNILAFQQGLRECLTSQTIRNNAVVYSNQLVYAEHDPYRPFIIRYYNWTVGVECDVQRNETSAGHIHHDSSNINSNLVTGASHYAVNMTFYRDPNFNNQILGYPLQVPVGTEVYVKVFTTTSDWTIKMRVHTCYTKPSQSSSDQMKYYLIRNGCETDVNTHIISQSSHETRFLFQDFEYTSNHEGINVYCDAIFCQSADYSRQCLQTCNPVVKRSVPKMSEYENNP